LQYTVINKGQAKRGICLLPTLYSCWSWWSCIKTIFKCLQ